jgi:hypothetical protein
MGGLPIFWQKGGKAPFFTWEKENLKDRSEKQSILMVFKAVFHDIRDFGLFFANFGSLLHILRLQEKLG